MTTQTSTWKWTMSGVEEPSSPGSMIRGSEDTGTVDAEGAGEVVEWLARYGPWDNFDQQERITIEIELVGPVGVGE